MQQQQPYAYTAAGHVPGAFPGYGLQDGNRNRADADQGGPAASQVPPGAYPYYYYPPPNNQQPPTQGGPSALPSQHPYPYSPAYQQPQPYPHPYPYPYPQPSAAPQPGLQPAKGYTPSSTDNLLQAYNLLKSARADIHGATEDLGKQGGLIGTAKELVFGTYGAVTKTRAAPTVGGLFKTLMYDGRSPAKSAVEEADEKIDKALDLVPEMPDVGSAQIKTGSKGGKVALAVAVGPSPIAAIVKRSRQKKAKVNVAEMQDEIDDALQWLENQLSARGVRLDDYK